MARVMLVLVVLLLAIPQNVLLAEDTGQATPQPVDTQPESSETVVATEETPTDTPTETSTESVAPTSAIEASPTEATLTPTLGPEPTQTFEEERPSLVTQAAPSTGAILTVDGQDGMALVPLGGTQTFLVGDLLDMAGDGFSLIQASNPDPDFYNFNGWWTNNEFLVYAGANCQGQFIRDLSTGRMQPESASATATMSGAVRTYSVQASQWLSVWWLEKSIDIVDTVDEVIVQPAVVRSNCVNVEMSVDYIELLANGSKGPITINEGDPIGLQSDQPTGDGWTQHIYESTAACYQGTSVTDGAVGATASTTLSRPPGTYWYSLNSTKGTDIVYGNCVQVTVQDIPGVLYVNGFTDHSTYFTGQTVPLYVEGYTPGASLVGRAYPGSADCSGSSYMLTTGKADSNGTLETSAPMPFTADAVSIKFIRADGGALEPTNCVLLVRLDTDIVLTVNGSLGPVLVDGGEIHFVATGLPENSIAYVGLNCSGTFEPVDDDLGQPITADGIFDGYMSSGLPDEFEIRVALGPDFSVTSNCVYVRLVDYLVDPQIAINGSQAPASVESGQHFTLTGITFPPDEAVSIHAFQGSSDCSGSATVSLAQSDNEGNLSADLVAGPAGPYSFLAESGGFTSNCVPLQITAAPIPPTIPPTVEVPTGAITLYANGQTAPLTLPGGTKATLTADGLGSLEPYRLDSYASADCSGTSRSLGNGVAGSDSVGSVNRYVASTMSIRLSADERVSNCLQVNWLATPPTTAPTGPVVSPTVSPTATGTSTTTPTGTAISPTATSTSTTTPTGTAVSPTATGTSTTIPTGTTTVPTGTISAPTGTDTTSTPSNGQVVGLPSAGGDSTKGIGTELIMLAAAAWLVLGGIALIVRRGARR